MAPGHTPPLNFIRVGYWPGRVFGGARSRVGQSFGARRGGGEIGGVGLVIRAGRAGLDRVKGMLASPAASQMAVFRRFLEPSAAAVTGSPVTGSPETAVFHAFHVVSRLIADYAARAASATRPDADRAAPGAESRGGRPPFPMSAPTMPLARSAAGPWGKSQGRPIPAVLPLWAGSERANATVDDGVGVREAPVMARTGRTGAEKTGPGAGEAAPVPLDTRARQGAARAFRAIGVHAVGAMVHGGGHPSDVKGAATICAPRIRVN